MLHSGLSLSLALATYIVQMTAAIRGETPRVLYRGHFFFASVRISLIASVESKGENAKFTVIRSRLNAISHLNERGKPKQRTLKM